MWSHGNPLWSQRKGQFARENSTSMDACCPHCGALLSLFAVGRGRRIHVAHCQRVKDALQSQRESSKEIPSVGANVGSSPMPAVPFEDDDAVSVLAAMDVDSVEIASLPSSPVVLAPRVQPTIPVSPLGSAADDFLASLIVRTPSLTLGIIKEIFTLISLGPMMCKSPAHLLRNMDALPGPEFTEECVKVDGIEYTVFYRPLAKMLRSAIRRLSSTLLVPVLQAQGSPIAELWQGETYQRHLQVFQSAAPANAILMPLIFYSGTPKF